MPRRLAFGAITFLEQPFLLLGTVFVCGLLSAGLFPNVTALLGVAFSLWLSAGLTLGLARRGAAVILLSAFFATGAFLGAIDTASIGPDRVRTQIERGLIGPTEPVILEGVIASAPEIAPDRLYLFVDAETVSQNHLKRKSTGRIQLIIPFNDGDDRRDYDALGLDDGARLRVLCHLRRPPGYRNPGSPSFHALLDQRGVDAIASIKSALLIEVLERRTRPGALRLLYNLRAAAIRTLLRTLSQPTSGVLVAAILGNHNFLDRRVAESFRSGGTYHLLVISGLHIALIASSLLYLSKLVVRGRTLRFVLVIGVVWGFAIMVGGQPAVTRAAAMVSIVLFGEVLFRRQMGANILGAAALILLTWEPRDIFNPGFQLSFLTVLAMVLGSGPLYERLRRIGEWRPSEVTPHPPVCPRLLRRFAEMVFWDQRMFERQMEESRIRYHLDKLSLPRFAVILQLPRIGRAVFVTLLTTIGIQSALLPVMILYFHRVSLVAPITNVIEALFIFVLMIYGCVYLFINVVDEGLAGHLSGGLNELGRIAIAISHLFDDLPRAAVRVPDFGPASPAVYGLYFMVIISLIHLLWRWDPLALRPLPPGQRRRRVLKRAGVITLVSVWVLFVWVLVAYPFEHGFERGRLSVTMLDVGQGDAMVISFPKGKLMLLDAGGRLMFGQSDGVDASPAFIEDRAGIGEIAIAPFLWRHGVSQIDMIAATHGDADHVQGFEDIVPAFSIREAFSGPAIERDPGHFPFPLAIARKGIARKSVSRGDRFEIDGVRVEVLAPFAEMRSNRYSQNDRSLVLRLTYGQRSFLLTGDIESTAEALLVASTDDLRADVLKVPHHGSMTSSSAEFLARVAPQFALISAGSPSPFGHPHAEVIARLASMKSRVLTTGACGAISFSTDGHDLVSTTFIKCE